MTLHGKDLKVHVCATKGGSYYEIDGIDTINFAPKRDDHETTDFKGASAGSGDYDEVRTFIKGLKNSSFTMSGRYLPSDTNGQAVIETAADAGTSVWLKFLYDGTNGHLVEALVDRTIDMGTGDIVKINITGQCISTWAATP